MDNISQKRLATPTMSAAEFLQRMFPPGTPIFICSYANDRADAKKFPPRDMVATDRKQVEAFIDANDVPGRACYFAVATMAGKKRGKGQVAKITCLHIDIDFHGIVEEDRTTVEAALCKLKVKPSAVVFSGHGLHCYWKYATPLGPEQIPSHEARLKQLCDLLAGDLSAAEVARVLRLPGSHNSKNGEWLDVEIIEDLTTWKNYSIAELDRWLLDAEPVLHYKPLPTTGKNNQPQNVFQLFGIEMRALRGGGFNINAALDDMQFHGVQNNGINVTFARVVGAIVEDEQPLAMAIRTLLPAAKAAYERDRKAGDGPWDDQRAIRRITDMYRRFSKKDAQKKTEEDFPAIGDEMLFDPWEEYIVPRFPKGVFPPELEKFIEAASENIGCDPAAMSMAVIAALSGSINHMTKLKMQLHGTFIVSAVIWILLAGPPSSKKTPIMNTALGPLEMIDAENAKQNRDEWAAYNALSPEGQKEQDKPKPPPRYVIYDSTPERLGEILADNEKGILCKRDEFSGFIGDLDRYGSSSRGANSTRAFYLKANDGGPYGMDRIGRKTADYIPNLSISMIGGIQPQKLAEMKGLSSDGLLQRFIPTMMQSARFPKDIPVDSAAYEALIRHVVQRTMCSPHLFQLQGEALAAMQRIQQRLFDIAQSGTGIANGFTEHVGKLSGYAGAMVLILHYAHNPERWTTSIDVSTVEKVGRLMDEFVLPHAMEFYRSMARSGGSGEVLQKVCSWLITSKKPRFTASDLASNVADFKGAGLFDINKRISPLVAVGWVKPHTTGPDNRAWTVDQRIYTQFAARAADEVRRKAELAKLMNSPRRAEGGKS